MRRRAQRFAYLLLTVGAVYYLLDVGRQLFTGIVPQRALMPHLVAGGLLGCGLFLLLLSLALRPEDR